MVTPRLFRTKLVQILSTPASLKHLLVPRNDIPFMFDNSTRSIVKAFDIALGLLRSAAATGNREFRIPGSQRFHG
jgi:hypothetical protein